MSSTGINYYINLLGIDTGDFAIFYPFTGIVNNYLPSVSYAQPQYSGQIFNGSGTFASVLNSGYFSGSNYVQISNITTGISGDMTMMLVYNRPTGVNGGVIFSSLTGNGIFNSGFLIGVNDANRLYFEYYDNNGPVVITSNNIYGQQNAVGINLSQTSLSFNYYDVNLKQLEIENFTIESQYLLFSNQWFLGKTFAPWLASRPFTGYLDHFLYFNTTLSQANIRRVFSGIFASPAAIPAVSGTILSTGITGYQLTLTGNPYIQSFSSYFSGFSALNTGYDCGTYAVFPTGIVNSPNFSYWGSGYAAVPLLAISTGYYQVSPITTGIVINSGYLANFGMDFVSYLWDRTPADNQEIIELTGVYNLGWEGQKSTYDNVVGEFGVASIYPSGNLNVFLNGVFQVESGYNVTGQYYNTELVNIADYYVKSTQFLYTNNFVVNTDVEYYDSCQEQNRLIVITTDSGSGNLTVSGAAVNNMMVFLNGQKLISGIDYFILAGGIFSGTTGITGILYESSVFFYGPFSDLVFCNQYTGFVSQTGNYDNYSGPRFTRGSTMYYLNGIRIDPSLYVESSVTDLISGVCIFDSGLTGMNNSGENINYWY